MELKTWPKEPGYDYLTIFHSYYSLTPVEVPLKLLFGLYQVAVNVSPVIWDVPKVPLSPKTTFIPFGLNFKESFSIGPNDFIFILSIYIIYFNDS